MEDRAASPAQAATGSTSVIYLAVIEKQTTETLRRPKKSTRPSLHTLMMSCPRSLFSISPTSLPFTAETFSHTRSISFFLPQASRIMIDTTARSTHRFSSKSASLPDIAAISACKKAYVFHFACKSQVSSVESCI